MTVPLLLNRRSGSARAQGLLDALPGSHRVAVEVPDGVDGLRRRVREHLDAGISRLIIAGGDGTLHHALQELAGSDCDVGILPLGSGNDLARALGLPLEPAAALTRALDGAAVPIDLGRAAGRVFAVAAGIGIDGEVLDFLEQRPALIRGAAIYPYALLRVLPRYRAPRLTLDLDGEPFDGDFTIAVAANASSYGGGMCVAPGARLDDGQLDVVLVARTSPLRLLGLLARVYRGRHLGRPGVLHRRVRRMRVQVHGEPRRLNADGELLVRTGSDSIEIEVLPGALRIVR